MAAVVGLDDSMLSAVANANFKTLAEGPIIDAQAHRNRMNGYFEASFANAVSSLNGQDPTVTDAIAQQIQQSGTLAQTLTQLNTVLAAIMQQLAAANAGGAVPAK